MIDAIPRVEANVQHSNLETIWTGYFWFSKILSYIFLLVILYSFVFSVCLLVFKIVTFFFLELVPWRSQAVPDEILENKFTFIPTVQSAFLYCIFIL